MWRCFVRDQARVPSVAGAVATFFVTGTVFLVSGYGLESPSPGGARSQGKGCKVNTGLREGSVYRVSP